jgi:trans-aconitate methyltransferase
MSSPADDFERGQAAYDEALARGLHLSGEGREYFAERRLEILADALERLGLCPRGAMDFGCGGGTATDLLRRRTGASAAIGVDRSPRLLAHARQHHSGPAVTFAARADYRPGAELDLVFCNGVFHHVASREQAGEVEFVRSCLRPGGVFALWENNPWSPAARWVMRRIPFDRGCRMLWPAQARRLLRAEGFEVVCTDFAFIFPRALARLRRVEPRLARLPLGAQYQVLARKVR